MKFSIGQFVAYFPHRKAENPFRLKITSCSDEHVMLESLYGTHHEFCPKTGKKKNHISGGYITPLTFELENKIAHRELAEELSRFDFKSLSLKELKELKAKIRY